MSELRIQAPDELVRQLRIRAQARRKSVEEIVLDDLRRGAAADAASGVSDVSGADEHADLLIALANEKLGPALARMVRQVSTDRRQELAKKASIGKPLSQIIIEDRGE